MMVIGLQLRVPCLVGVLEEEKNRPQELMVHVEVWTALAHSDAIDKTINYVEMEKVVVSALQEKHHQLIETKASHLIKTLKTLFPSIKAARVRIEKPEARLPFGSLPYVEMKQEFSS